MHGLLVALHKPARDGICKFQSERVGGACKEPAEGLRGMNGTRGGGREGLMAVAERFLQEEYELHELF